MSSVTGYLDSQHDRQQLNLPVAHLQEERHQPSLWDRGPELALILPVLSCGAQVLMSVRSQELSITQMENLQVLVGGSLLLLRWAPHLRVRWAGHT